ncbi:MAG TPA: trehalase-like domain-containing protein, partial [Microlunatus sp.]|nr:trehalase-like domain-containing protein [Microlunatus sp.]
MDYPLIADHGLIGDLQTAALVSTHGSIDWFCTPRFDSPSVFGAILDRQQGGHFRIRPTQDAFATKQLYLPDTAVLITRFLTEDGVGEVVDFMPVTSGKQATENHRIVRLLRCVRGRMEFDLDIAPRFDYGRQPHKVNVSENGVVFESNGSSVTLHLVREPDDVRLVAPRPVAGDSIHVSFPLEAGQVRGLILETAADGPPRQV